MKSKTAFLATLGGLFGALVGVVTNSKQPGMAAAVGATAGAVTLVGVDRLISKPAEQPARG